MEEAEQQTAGIFSEELLINPPTGVEARIVAVISPVLEQLGFRIVRVRLLGLNGLTLQIMAERLDGSMTIEDCELLSKRISPLLDVENLIDKRYNLELSSPGMDRPLTRKSDFVTWRGQTAKIETHIPVDGRKKFRGIIKTINSDTVNIRYTAKDGTEVNTDIPFAAITEANLILTDDLIRAVLQQDKHKETKEIKKQEFITH